MPTPDYLRLQRDWHQENAPARGISLEISRLENDELRSLLYTNLSSVEFNRYNLEVYLSIAGLFRQNELMLKALDEINTNLERAQEQAAGLKYTDAVAALDQALDTAGRIRDERNRALQDVTFTWYKSWFPRVREANGRRVARSPQSFVDTASTESARRLQEGMVYLIDREFSLPFGEWANHFGGRSETANAAAHKVSDQRESQILTRQDTNYSTWSGCQSRTVIL